MSEFTLYSPDALFVASYDASFHLTKVWLSIPVYYFVSVFPESLHCLTYCSNIGLCT